MVRHGKPRSAMACHPCHSSKVRCTGGSPCERCRSSNRECSYPARDRPVTVSESYLRGLEREVRRARRVGHNHQSDDDLPAENAAPGSASVSSDPGAMPLSDAVRTEEQQRRFGDSSAELLVKTLRELPFVKEPELPEFRLVLGDSMSSPYTYSPLDFDFLQPKVSFKLPPKMYALHLVRVFEEGFCDYHWYMRKSFGERLAMTYDNPSSQAADRSWLCQVSVVLALGETWLHGRTKDVESPRTLLSEPPAPPKPPGTDFFEQSLLLLKPSLEEPTITDVEVLNLVAYYSYSLNRRRTAYFYARQAITLAQCLRLHQSPKPPKANVVHAEHHKRVWWTCYCIHQMISTELGLPSLYDAAVDWSQPPSSANLAMADSEQFFNGELLTAHAKICLVRDKVIQEVTQRQLPTEIGGLIADLNPCVNLLHQWRHELPTHMSFTFDNGIEPRMVKLPYSRALASLYLRYHQCIILLLRPLLLSEISNLTRQPSLDPNENTKHGDHQDERLKGLKAWCLQAARSNCKILLSLEATGMIAKFGYWESLHLFTGVTTLLLFSVVPSIDGADVQSPTNSTSSAPNDGQIYNTPGTTDCNNFRFGNETGIYERSKDLLSDMAAVGNPAAKDYVTMLADVEVVVQKISTKEHLSMSVFQALTSGLETEGQAAMGSLCDLGEIDWESLL